MPMSGDWATWVQDALLAVTAGFAYLAFRKQSDQVAEDRAFNVAQLAVLRDQLENERKSGKQQTMLFQRQVDEQRAFNEEQMKVLALQADALNASRLERQWEAVQRRKQQAAMVFLEVTHYDMGTTVGGGSIDLGETYAVEVSNTSSQPVYEVTIKWHKGAAEWVDGGVSVEKDDRLMPGTTLKKSRSYHEGGNLNTVGAVLEFRDSAGVRWRRTNDGQLEDMDANPTGSNNE
jgi:hypothetical protein